MNIKNIFASAALLVVPALLSAQSNSGKLPQGKKDAAVVVPGDKISLNHTGGISLFPVLSNTPFEVKPVWGEGETPWFSVSQLSCFYLFSFDNDWSLVVAVALVTTKEFC